MTYPFHRDDDGRLGLVGDHPRRQMSQAHPGRHIATPASRDMLKRHKQGSAQNPFPPHKMHIRISACKDCPTPFPLRHCQSRPTPSRKDRSPRPKISTCPYRPPRTHHVVVRLLLLFLLGSLWRGSGSSRRGGLGGGRRSGGESFGIRKVFLDLQRVSRGT